MSDLGIRSARFIAADDDSAGAPRMRRGFRLDQPADRIRSAELLLTAHGLVEARINGAPSSDAVLTPGWSSYPWRLRVARHDVREQLAAGSQDAVLALVVGNGWYRGQLTWAMERDLYGTERAALAELVVVYEDGSEQRVATDASWRSAPGAILSDDLYDGETIDARLLDPAWQRPGFDDSGWGGVHEVDADPAVLTPYIGPEVVRHEEIAPVSITASPSGRTLVDFGQNLVGWIRVRVHGEEGDEIVIRHAEVLEGGELGTRPLRRAKAQDRYILSGGDDVLEPTFTFHGFRYAEVEGWPGGSIPDGALTAIVVSSDLRRTGTFACSDPDLTRFHENVVWGMRGNFVDVPTDCPQRDERLGWTGDLSAFAPTAAFLFDVDGFLRDWLRDLAAEQADRDGLVPYVVPDPLVLLREGETIGDQNTTALWSDAAVWVPWTLWQAYGDRRVLEDQWDSMLAHVRRVGTLLSPSGLWDAGFQFGDWLDPDAPPEDAARAKADPGVVATACAYRSADLLARIAALLGRPEESELRERAEDLRAAFREHYVDRGVVRSDCATVYALAIVFDLLAHEDRAVAGDRLAELVRSAGHRISTGFAGTPFVTDALTETGHLEDAYGLLLQREVPSWLYPVTMGATTVWERWDSMLPDGSINPGEMTSFNHYALGAVADWMHRTVGGIAPLSPGYERILIAPRPGPALDWVSCSLASPHGRIAVDWRREGSGAHVEVEVPEGTTAVFRSPDGDDEELAPGRHRLELTGDAPGRR